MKNPITDAKLRLLFLSLTLSVAYVLLYDYLPLHRLQLIPSPLAVSVYNDTTGSTGVWLNKEKHTFRCTYVDTPSNYKYCGMNIQLGDGQSKGIDLTSYDTIHLQMHYTGAAEILRLYVRNFNPQFSELEASRNTTKYNSMLLPVKDLSHDLDIHFTEFSVAEWWIRSSGLPRAMSSPEFDNVVNLGIDPPFPAPFGNHDFDIQAMSLSGPVVSKENWYLALLICWFIGLVGVGIARHYTLQRIYSKNQQQLKEEQNRSERITLESEKYKEMAVVDLLTGTLNRRGFGDVIDRMLHASDISRASIIMLDIDWFKAINDTYGHQIGDKVLSMLGNLLSNKVREHDEVGRWGGEEFVVFCPNTSCKGAVQLAENLREAVKVIKVDEKASPITVSFGVAAVNNDSWDEALRHADVALYTAKNAGRNCVRGYTEEMENQ